MDTSKLIQIAIVRIDLAICRARASPWGCIAAALIVGAVLYIVTQRGAKTQ